MNTAMVVVMLLLLLFKSITVSEDGN